MRLFNKLLLATALCLPLSLGAQNLGPPAPTVTIANATDYVAGTWTPVLAGSTTAGTPTYTIQAGSYEQIGRNVTVRFIINITAWGGTPAGNATITGLPSATSSATNNYSSCYIGTYTVSGLAASSFGISGFISPGSTTIALQQQQTAGAVSITPAQVGTANTAQFIGECNYHI